jgi:hypothetical protein
MLACILQNIYLPVRLDTFLTQPDGKSDIFEEEEKEKEKNSRK